MLLAGNYNAQIRLHLATPLDPALSRKLTTHLFWLEDAQFPSDIDENDFDRKLHRQAKKDQLERQISSFIAGHGHNYHLRLEPDHPYFLCLAVEPAANPSQLAVSLDIEPTKPDSYYDRFLEIVETDIIPVADPLYGWGSHQNHIETKKTNAFNPKEWPWIYLSKKFLEENSKFENLRSEASREIDHRGYIIQRQPNPFAVNRT